MFQEEIKIRELKPVVCAYIRDAQLHFEPEAVPDDSSVHDVRVLMKKARASVKLLKPQMDEESYLKEYNALREVGRIMRSWRETTVHRKLLRVLKKKYRVLFRELAQNEKLISLLSPPEDGVYEKAGIREDIIKIVDLLHRSGYRWRFRSGSGMDKYLMLKELEVTYKKVSVSFLKARNYPKSENLHDFRKKAKDFLYQLFYFRAMKPKVIKEVERKLDLMAQNLGKYNDYSVLIEAIGYRYLPGGNSTPVDELVLLIKQEQDKYLSKVWPSAFSVFRPGLKLADVLGLKIVIV